MSIHLICRLCAFRIANFFLRPPRIRFFRVARPCGDCNSGRCSDSRDNRGSASTNSNSDGMAASLRPRMYLAGEIRLRVLRPPLHVVSSLITYAIIFVKLFATHRDL